MTSYRTETGIYVTDRRHDRVEFDDPRTWPPNPNVDPPPPDRPGVGPNMSEGFGNQHVMWNAPSSLGYTSGIYPPPVMPWSGWPVEWATPGWGGAVGLDEMIQRVSLVFACIDLNSSQLASMPPYRLVGTETVLPLPWQRNPQPEVYTGWTEAFKQIAVSYWSAGEVFLWATSRYADGQVRNFVMLNPGWVDVEMEGQTRTYDLAGEDITGDVLHIRYLSWPGVPRGIGPLEALATSLFGVQAMEAYQANLASRGGIPWGILSAPGNLTQDQATGMREQFMNARLSSMGSPAVLSGGVTLQPFTITPKDMALLELRQFDEARIATVLGVPPSMMALPSGDQSMVYRNIEGIYDWHWRAYLRVRAKAITEAISNWALPSTQSLELNTDEYTRPGLKERVDAYVALNGIGAMTVEEIRAVERLAGEDPGNAALDPTQNVGANVQPTPEPEPPEPVMNGGVT